MRNNLSKEFLLNSTYLSPLFHKFVLETLFLGFGLVLFQVRRKIPLIIRKSRIAKLYGRSELRKIFSRRFFSLILIHDFVFHRYLLRRGFRLKPTRRAGMLSGRYLHKNPITSSFLLRNKLIGEHVLYKYLIFSPILNFYHRLKTPIFHRKVRKSKLYFFTPNLTKFPVFRSMQ